MIGEQLGHYRILERLGAGGMGVVYKAADTHLNRTVAIKVLAPEAVADPARRQRFIQEAHAASALDHPNIVTIYDIAESEGRLYIVMQYIAGKPLRELVRRGRLPLPDALRYALQIADALARAHSRGIVHRDLKPENVMVSDEEQVKILDFGLAKLTEPLGAGEEAATATMDRFRTEEGQVVGTAAYMSPEQAQGRKVDARSDIFAFGVLLYEMVTGRQPFRGDNRLSVLSAVVRDEPERLSGMEPSLPPDLDKLITRALRKDPERRWQTMADVRVALAEIREESESGSGVAVAPTPAARRPRWLWPAVALLAVLVAGLLGWRLSRSSAPPTPLATTTPLTSFPGLEMQPAFSPDGRQVAFAWNGEGQDNFDIYVKLIGAGAPLRLTTDPAADVVPSWSPDGRYIAFVRVAPTGAPEVLLAPALGGSERRLGTVAIFFRAAKALSWRADGKWLAVLGRSSPSDPVAIFLLNIETGEGRRITNPPPLSFGDYMPVFSPDGSTLAFARFIGTGMNSDLWLLSLDPAANPRGEPRRLTSEELSLAGFDWSADGRSLIVACNRGGAEALWRLPIQGTSAWERLPFGDAASHPAVARQGGRLAYANILSDTNLYRLAGSGAPVKLCSSTRFDGSPRFSPDGQRFVFVSDRSGTREMWACDVTGSKAVQLTAGIGSQAGSPRWSPDGRSVAFDDFRDGHWHIMAVRADGGPSRRLTTEAADHVRPAWSPDGKWIYFGSNRSGQDQIWKMPSGGGPPVQVTRNGGWDAIASPDGRHVYYAQRSQPGIWRVLIEGGEETQVLDRGRQGRWAVVASGLYLADTTTDGIPFVDRFPLDGGAPTRVAELPKGAVIASSPALAVSPDGRTIILALVDQTESDILLVENFR